MTKSPHFFKAKSRLGIPHIPFRSIEQNIGVEKAPDAILTQEFLKAFFSFYRTTEFIFPKPEDISISHYYEILTESLIEFKTIIQNSLEGNEIQIVIGGDNSVTFSSLLARLELIKDPAKLGYIQFDSHGECLQFSESSTKNFHGMYLRSFFDTFDIGRIDRLVPKKLPSENILMIGNLDLEREEKNVLKKFQIQKISHSDFFHQDEAVYYVLQQFLNAFTHIHINFDIDVFDKSIAPATGAPNPNEGFHKEEVFSLLGVIKKHPSWSFDLCEVNPQKRGGEPTVKLAQELLLFLLNQDNP